MDYKQLQIQDLVARLPYKPCISVKINDTTWESFVLAGFDGIRLICQTLESSAIKTFVYFEHDFKLHLRSLSSMTEEEKDEFLLRISADDIFDDIIDFGECLCEGSPIAIEQIGNAIDYFNSKHFDYRCLGELGLAENKPYPFLKAYGYNC